MSMHYYSCNGYGMYLNENFHVFRPSGKYLRK